MTQQVILVAVADLVMLFMLGFAAFKCGYWRCRRLMGEKIIDLLGEKSEKIGGAYYVKSLTVLDTLFPEAAKAQRKLEKENEAEEGGRR